MVDFNLLSGSFGASGKLFGDGDFSMDGAIDSADFSILVAQFGKRLGAPAAVAAPSIFSSTAADDDADPTLLR